MKEGQRAENGWKPQVYTDIIASFKTIGFRVVTRAQLDNKRDVVCMCLLYSGYLAKQLTLSPFDREFQLKI